METFDFVNYDYKRSLLFCGPTGVGKTYTALKLLRNYKSDTVAPGILTYEISDAKFKQMVKSNMIIMRTPKEWENDIKMYPLEVMLRCGLLLYDDLGVSDVSEAYLRDFTFIIDERIKKGLPNIFTTNLSKEELRNKLDERIVSRILFNTDVVVFTGPDKRLSTTNYFVSPKSRD